MLLDDDKRIKLARGNILRLPCNTGVSLDLKEYHLLGRCIEDILL